jgi:hypothetical protein
MSNVFFEALEAAEARIAELERELRILQIKNKKMTQYKNDIQKSTSRNYL